jgi:hypothetical protein
MQRVYVLGAGASRFAGFPLGGELLPFLRSEWKNSKDLMVKVLGRYALDFIEQTKPSLPAERILSTGEPDLEFVLSLTERNSQNSHNAPDYQCLIKDLDIIANQFDLDAWDLPRVR